MSKSRSALRLGGALAVLLVLVSLIACAESSKSPADDTDVTVEVLLDGNEISARSLTSTTEEYDTSYSSSALYWTYTAVKKDGYFTTGQTSSETWLSTMTSTDEEGNETTTVNSGLPSALPGKFSVGDWVFTFNAYTSAEMKDDCLYYQGTGSSATLSSGGENTVSVTVNLYEAVKNADENGVNYGTLSITIDTLGISESFSVTVQAGSNDALTAATYTYSDGSWTVEGTDLMGLTGDAACYSTSLASGYYSVMVTATTTSGAEYSATEDDVLIKPNLTTTLTGSLSAANDAALYAALVSGGSVTLTKDFTLSSSYLPSGTYITSASELTIDLNGYTLSATTLAGSFKIPASSSVTIKGGTLSVTRGGSTNATSLLILVQDNASLTLDSVTISADNGSIIVPSASSTVTIKDSTLYTKGAYVLSTEANTSSNDSIYIYNSTLTAEAGHSGDADDGGTAVMINVASTALTIEGSTLTGSRQALVVRCGTASVKDSKLVSLGTLTGNTDRTTTWGGTNEVPYTTLVVGNKSSYTGTASMTLANTSLSIVTNEVDHNDGELLDLAYVSGINGYNVSLTYDSSTTGTVYTYETDSDGNKASTATATTVSDILTEGHTYVYADSSTTVTVTNSSQTYTYSNGYGVYGSDTLTNSSSS